MRPVLFGLALAGGFALTAWIVAYYVSNGWLLADAHAYWSTGQAGYQPYLRGVGELDAYLYSPAFAQAIAVITWLPWPAFAALWVALEAGAFLWLLRPLGWAWAGVGLLWCSPELALGNIYGLLAVATVLALRGLPQAWTLAILTKPSLAVGLGWHVVRREWRQLAIACGVVAAITLVSVWIDPEMWSAWLAFLAGSTDGVDWLLLVRLVLAVMVVVLGARAGLAWLVPFGMMLATPTVGSISVVTVLAAVPRLVPSQEPVAASHD